MQTVTEPRPACYRIETRLEPNACTKANGCCEIMSERLYPTLEAARLAAESALDVLDYVYDMSTHAVYVVDPRTNATLAVVDSKSPSMPSRVAVSIGGARCRR